MGLPKRTVISRPRVATERHLMLIELKTMPGHHFKGKTESDIKRRDLELRIISHRLVGPKMILIFRSIRTQVPLFHFSL